jgi:thiol-disulfide isomerase/thioredoxin
MRGGKTRKQKASSRTVMGSLLPPIDITEPKQLSELDKRIRKGPLTLVLVYADWCGHCQSFKPMMEQLESCPERSIQTARVREDMFPQSSISSAKIEGYPTLLLVKQSGEVASFKNDQGEITNAIPEHTDMQKMTAIVKNVGTNAGQNALASSEVVTPYVSSSEVIANESVVTPDENTSIPKNIIADRLSANHVNTLNRTLVRSADQLLKQATAPIVKQGGGCGSLWSNLMLASQKVAPAALLFLGAESMKRRRTTKRRRSTKGKRAGK